jgi:NAD(P)-dependent dehydrogenase (short-subunit alcohol dehydrogenase family)
LSDINQQKIDEIQKHPLINKKIFIENVNAGDPDSVKKYFESLSGKISSIDALINNVGVAGPTGLMEDLSIVDWRQTIDINLNSHFYFTKYAIPLLKKNKEGSIINISSTAGLFGFPLRTPYVASKWAVIGMTKSLAMELGEFDIRVNAICPGSVSGDRMKRVIEAKAKSLGISEKELQEDYESMVSLKTFVDKEDIANMALFLLSNESHKVSGQIMTVDGNTERMN